MLNKKVSADKVDYANGVGWSNEQEYKAFYVDYYRRLYNYGMKLNQDTALIEDVIQETFLHLWTQKRNLDHVDSLKSYLFGVFRFKLLEQFRTIKKRESIAIDLLQDTVQFSVEHFIIEHESHLVTQEKIKHALAKLSDRQREIVFLKFYENLSYEEIAVVLDITVKGSYKLMARAIAELKSQIKGTGTAYMLLMLKLMGV